MQRRNFLLAAPFVIIGSRLAVAQDAASPPVTGPVLLTVDGDIARPSQGSTAVFDQQRLDQLPQNEFRTSTIWTEGLRRFSGPTLQGLLDDVVAGSGEIMATAINDYVVDISRSLVKPTTPIIANRIDGMPFSVRKKGPLWIVFPYDSDPLFRSEPVYASSVWQLSKLTIQQS
ncbi:oxidoreductase [Yoonia sp.]|uniref:oxidoreductase n=1 Tax=Yoonia sp. TaxID=2212373 RepID=UPI0035900A43